MKPQIRFVTVAMLLFLPASMLMQSGGNFTVTRSNVGAGGGSSSGGDFGINSTIGQPISGDLLTGAQFSVTSGFWTYTVNPASGQGVEGDVAGRPSGDGSVLSNDVVQVQRFQIGLDQPDQLNEFQRADSAPFVSKGDGAIDSTDVVQTQRYQIGLNEAQSAAGPIDDTGFSFTSGSEKELTAREDLQEMSQGGRALRVQGTDGSRGMPVIVNIRADAIGDESAYGFRVTYDQAILTAPTTAIGTAGGSRFCNTGIAGQINCSVNNFLIDQPGTSTDQIGEILPGSDQLLLTITFTVAASAAPGLTSVGLTNVNASNDAAANLVIGSQNGSVNVLGPVAAGVSVSGRVSDMFGRGVPLSVVRIDDGRGFVRSTRTNSFGYYRLTDIPAGETYVVSVNDRLGRFSPRVVFLTEDLSGLDFAPDRASFVMK